jgi:hypothetical protein
VQHCVGCTIIIHDVLIVFNHCRGGKPIGRRGCTGGRTPTSSLNTSSITIIVCVWTARLRGALSQTRANSHRWFLGRYFLSPLTFLLWTLVADPVYRSILLQHIHVYCMCVLTLSPSAFIDIHWSSVCVISSFYFSTGTILYMMFQESQSNL